jgi:hypothetical protein
MGKKRAFCCATGAKGWTADTRVARRVGGIGPRERGYSGCPRRTAQQSKVRRTFGVASTQVSPSRREHGRPR